MMLLSSSVGSPPVVPGAWPAWRVGKPVGVPFQIAGTSLSTVPGIEGPLGPTGHELTQQSAAFGMIDNYNGLAQMPDGFVQALGGGHDGWSGNGAQRIDLTQDAPAWVILFAGSAPIYLGGARPMYQGEADPGPAQHFADGRPNARHTYYALQHIPARNRVFSFYCVSPFPGGGTDVPNKVDAFDLALNDYDPYPSYTNSTKTLGPAACCCRHPTTQDVYISSALGGGNTVWRQTTGLWEDWGATLVDSYTGSLIDVARNRWISYASNAQLTAVDLTTHAQTPHYLSGMEGFPGFAGYAGLVHDTHNDWYFAFDQGQMFKYDPDTYAGELYTYIPAGANNYSNRVGYFPNLGGVALLADFVSTFTFIPTE